MPLAAMSAGEAAFRSRSRGSGASATRLRSAAGFDTRDLKEAKALLEELSQ